MSGCECKPGAKRERDSAKHQVSPQPSMIDPSLIALILGVDCILDMCRTTLNVPGDIAAAAYIA
jgi:hypothetical protein